MLKKAISFLLFGLFILSITLGSTVSVIYAQEESLPPESPRQAPWGPSYDKDEMAAYRAAIKGDNCASPSLECLVHQTSRFVAIEWVNSMIYRDSTPYDSGSAPAPGAEDEGASNPRSGGVIIGLGQMINAMYSYPAARTSVYVADVLDSARIVPRAYAQGLGFSALNPILELWKAFRNIAYMFFIVVIIVIGFTIMFRKNVGGQAAVTAQQAIPSVITSLIFVTFSYAIAGLLIDMMYLFMYMIIGIFGATAPGLITGRIIDYNIFTLMMELFSPLKQFSTNWGITDVLFESAFGDNLASDAFSFFGGLTLTVVLTIAVLIGTFRLFFELLKSYASIVASVVTSPLTLMLGALPGSKNVFADWVWDLIGNLSAFPTVLIVVILYYQFTKAGATNATGFLPPFLIGAAGQTGIIGSLMGLAIILALPDIVKDMKKRMGAGEGFGMMVANAAKKSFVEGVRGGEVIDGLPITNTRNIPIFGSGKQTASAIALGTSAVANMATRGLYNARKYAHPGYIPDASSRGARWSMRNFGNPFGNLLEKKVDQWRENRDKEDQKQNNTTNP